MHHSLQYSVFLIWHFLKMSITQERHNPLRLAKKYAKLNLDIKLLPQ